MGLIWRIRGARLQTLRPFASTTSITASLSTLPVVALMALYTRETGGKFCALASIIIRSSWAWASEARVSLDCSTLERRCETCERGSAARASEGHDCARASEGERVGEHGMCQSTFWYI